MKKKKGEEPIGIAFWKYDLYPFLLSGHFTRLRGAEVYVPSYQGYVLPVFILDEEKGSNLAIELNNLRFKKQEAIKEVDEAFYTELQALLKKFQGKLK